MTAVLRTGRLVLRPICLSDARRILTGAAVGSETWAPGYPLADEVGLLRLMVDADTEPDGWGPWQLLTPTVDRLVAVGGIGFLGSPDGLGEVEVGFGLVPSARGQGLAAEALTTLVQWAGRRGAAAVYGTTTADHLASQHTMLRAGLVLRAGLRGTAATGTPGTLDPAGSGLLRFVARCAPTGGSSPPTGPMRAPRTPTRSE